MRFMNDYRNIADDANAGYVAAWAHGTYEMRVVAMRRIEADEEILADYGEEYWKVPLTLILTALSPSSSK